MMLYLSEVVCFSAVRRIEFFHFLLESENSKINPENPVNPV